MKQIIITIRDRQNRFQMDLEVPVDQPGAKVTEDVIEFLNFTNPELRFNAYYHGLYLERQKRILKDKETLAQAGVLNGDYITVVIRS